MTHVQKGDPQSKQQNDLETHVNGLIVPKGHYFKSTDIVYFVFKYNLNFLFNELTTFFSYYFFGTKRKVKWTGKKRNSILMINFIFKSCDLFIVLTPNNLEWHFFAFTMIKFDMKRCLFIGWSFFISFVEINWSSRHQLLLGLHFFYFCLWENSFWP